MGLCCRYLRLSILIVIITAEGLHSSKQKDAAAEETFFIPYGHSNPFVNLTTSSGSPIPISDTETLDRKRTDEHLLLNDFFVETTTHLVGERIPARVVHAKGTGAFGTFTVTHDLSDICKADVFRTVGKVTPVVARFSLAFQPAGGSDVARDARGFAVKFYTKEGNYDFVGNDVEMFAIKEPTLFPGFAHAFSPNPRTQLVDANARWDFLTLRPESLSMFMRIFGDPGIPDGYRHMRAGGLHTFELLNDLGDRTYVRFHLIPDLGIRNLTNAQAQQIQATDLNYATRDLFNAIAAGNYPTWTFCVQTISDREAKKVKFNIFDPTHYWSEHVYPLRPIGTVELNKNPRNQFRDVEQLAFNPGNLVPGIRGVDPLFESRVFAYRAAHLHRLGTNFNKIHVNFPQNAEPKTYNRDGVPPVRDNDAEYPNYYPNSFYSPRPYMDHDPPRIGVSVDPKVDNFNQAREVYFKMSEAEKCRLIDTIVTNLRDVKPFIQNRAVKLYYVIHEEIGSRIENGLKMSVMYPNQSLDCDEIMH